MHSAAQHSTCGFLGHRLPEITWGPVNMEWLPRAFENPILPFFQLSVFVVLSSFPVFSKMTSRTPVYRGLLSLPVMFFPVTTGAPVSAAHKDTGL